MSSLTLTLTESNVSVANNTSDVTVAVTVKFTDGWWAAHEVGSSMSVSCNGTSKTLSFGPYNIGANGSKSLGSVKFTGIKHNSDGSKSVSASATWVVPFGNGYKVSGSASKTLTKIARASSIGTINGSTLGSALTVNISRLNSGFTHTVTYRFGSITRSYTGQATSCVFTPPLSDASQIPGAVSGTGSASVQTYSGSTVIGSAVSKSFTLNLPTSAVPSMSGPTISKVDNGVPAAWGVYVKGFSKANVSISGAGIYGSTISSYAISGGGYSSSSNTLSTGVLNTPGSNTFTGTIRDSRSRTATASGTITVVDYTNPSVSLSAERCNSNGVANTDGVYVKVIASFTYASVSGKNSIASKKITVGSYTNTAFTSGNAVILGGALSTDKSYTAEVTISDALGRTATAQATVPTGAVTIDLKAGGKGIAFGKVAEIDNRVDSAWPMYAQGQRLANISESCINRGVIPASANLNNYTTTGFYHQPANANAASGSNYPIAEAGMLIVYNPGYMYQTYYHYYGNGVWTRTCYNGTWSAWQKLAKNSDAMTPLAHHHNYDMWSGSQLLTTSEWIGWYDGFGGNAKRKGWIGHNKSTNFTIANDAGGRVIINCETVVEGRLNVKNLGYISGYTADKSTRMWIGVVGDNDQVYIGDAATGTIIRGKSIKLGSTSGATVTSDKNLKKDINSINHLYKNFFKSLNPVSYKYDIEGHKRSHIGFIAQDVEDALSNNELTANDFAGLCIDNVEDYEVNRDDPEMKTALAKDLKKVYSLRYEEFIALNTVMIQENVKEIQSLKKDLNKKLDELEERIIKLEI